MRGKRATVEAQTRSAADVADDIGDLLTDSGQDQGLDMGGAIELLRGARETLNALVDPELRANLGGILDWAMRDQEECAQCGDPEGERESRANLRMIEKTAKTLDRLLGGNEEK